MRRPPLSWTGRGPQSRQARVGVQGLGSKPCLLEGRGPITSDTTHPRAGLTVSLALTQPPAKRAGLSLLWSLPPRDTRCGNSGFPYASRSPERPSHCHRGTP